MPKNSRSNPEPVLRDQPLKLAPLLILRILEEETDIDHPMTASSVRRRLADRFKLSMNYKAIANNLNMLLGLYPDRIMCDTKERSDGKGGVQTIATGWYCEPVFEPSELRYLADALASSQRMPQRQKKDLWKKIGSLGGAHAKKLVGIGDIYGTEPKGIVNKQLFNTISILDEALKKGYHVQFYLGVYDINGKLGLGEKEDPEEVDPRFMAVSDGRYYLFASYPGSDKLYHFCIDLMLEADICTDENGEPVKASITADRHPDVQKYLEKHLYMYSDPIVPVKLRMQDTPINRHQIFDRFGISAKFQREAGNSDHLIVEVQANETAMRFWALQYSGMVEVLEPQSLRDALHAEALRVAAMYDDGTEEHS